MLKRTRVSDAGFTLVEIVVSIALVALLAAAITMQMVRRTVDGEAAALSRNIDSLSRGVVAFRNDVRRYPGRLSYLPTAPAVGSKDSCGSNIPARFLAYWRGPYVERVISTDGISSGSSTIQDSLHRVVVSDTVLRIVVEGVDEGVADLVERNFDTVVDPAAGTIRWTLDADARGTLTYSFPVRGC